MINIKFLNVQAMFSVHMKMLARLAQTLGTAKKIIATKLKMIFIKPGLPNLVPAAFIPVTVELMEGIYTHGTKHIDINAIATRIPK